MGHHDEQSQQHGMGQSGLEGSQKEREMLEGSPSGGMEQGTSQVGTHGNAGYDQTTAYGQEGDMGYDRQPNGAGYGQSGDAGLGGQDSDLGTGYGQGGDMAGGYGQGSGFDRTSGTGFGQENDLGTTSTGGAQQGDMTQEPYTQDDATRSGNTGWNDRSETEREGGTDR